MGLGTLSPSSCRAQTGEICFEGEGGAVPWIQFRMKVLLLLFQSKPGNRKH